MGTSRATPSCSSRYAFGRSAGMVKSAAVWKTIDSSRGVRSVPTSVSHAGTGTGSTAAAARRKRTSVAAGAGGASVIPSSSSNATCSLSGTRFSR